jgi:hypothetical protein
LLSCNAHICQYTFWVPDRFLGGTTSREERQQNTSSA